MFRDADEGDTVWDEWEIPGFSSLADRGIKLLGFVGILKPIVWKRSWLKGWDQLWNIEMQFNIFPFSFPQLN